MREEDIINWLQSQTDKKFIELFYRAAATRHLHPLERSFLDSHLLLAHAKRDRSEGHMKWELELVGCPDDATEWDNDASVAQFGEHCGHHVASWAKRFPCPVCGEVTHGT